jgi:hypothetical protein
MSNDNWDYGTPSGVRPNAARGIGGGMGSSTPPAKPSKPVSLGNSRLIIGAVCVLIVGAIVFGFMQFVGKSGSQVAETERETIQRGQDTSPKVDLNIALTTARTSFGIDGSYQGLTAATLSQSEPEVHFTDGASSRPGLVSVFANGTSFGAAEVSASGTCFYIRDSGGATGFATGTGSCTGRDALLKATGSSW